MEGMVKKVVKTTGTEMDWPEVEIAIPNYVVSIKQHGSCPTIAKNTHFKPFGLSGRIQTVLLLVEVGQKQRKGLAGTGTLGKGDVLVAPAKLKDVLKELVVCIRICYVDPSSIQKWAHSIKEIIKNTSLYGIGGVSVVNFAMADEEIEVEDALMVNLEKWAVK